MKTLFTTVICTQKSKALKHCRRKDRVKITATKVTSGNVKKLAIPVMIQEKCSFRTDPVHPNSTITRQAKTNGKLCCHEIVCP